MRALMRENKILIIFPRAGADSILPSAIARRKFDRNQATALRLDDGLRARMHGQFRVDMFDVRLHCADGETERLRHSRIGTTA